MAIKDDAFFLAVGVVVIIGAAWYAKKKIGDVAGAVGDAVGAAGTAIYNGVAKVGQAVADTADATYTDARVANWMAVHDGALNVGGTINALQTDTGMNQDQSTAAELMALGSMGA
jgi:hypothetical protein